MACAEPGPLILVMGRPSGATLQSPRGAVAQGPEVPAGGAKVDAAAGEPPTSPNGKVVRVTERQGREDDWFDLLSRFGSVLAALVAAGLAFLAAQYNEKKSWYRRKAEQLRDKQLDKLIDGARTLNDVLSSFDSSTARLDELKARSEGIGSQRDVSRAEIQALSRSWGIDLDKKVRDLELCRMEVRLLQVGPEVDGILARAIDAVRGTVRTLSLSGTTAGALPFAEIDEQKVRLKSIANELVEKALWGLEQ
jgi:hypothetical protein